MATPIMLLKSWNTGLRQNDFMSKRALLLLIHYLWHPASVPANQDGFLKDLETAMIQVKINDLPMGKTLRWPQSDWRLAV